MAILKVDTISGIGTEGPVFEGDIEFTSQNFLTLPKGDTTQRGRGRGFIGGGSDGSLLKTIQYLEIQSQGNAIDFGDSTNKVHISAGAASPTRAAFFGGYTGTGSPNATNEINFVEIATTGNAQDFGDLLSSLFYSAGCSNGHGGL